ncbi:AMP-binding protein, partial [Escherichia coli]|nr:AMP-binding protein [Escherichia coli]
IMNDSGAETLIVFDALYPRVKGVQSKTKLSNIIVVSLQQSNADFSPDKTFDGFLHEGKGQFTPVNIEPEQEIAVLQYTGGTTGRSKG